MYEPNGMGRLAIHLLVLVGWLTILQLLLRANFREAADVSRSLLTKHLALEPAFSASGLLLTFGFCFLAWFLLGKFLNDLFGLPPVIDVLIQIIAIFSSFDTVGYPFIVSLAEVLVGACFAACLILLLTNFASRRLKVGQAIEVLIPYMFAIPVLASLFLLGWPIPLRSTFGVVLISVFPCMQVMWRAVNDIGYRVIPIAISEALPFAFVGMIFGEAMFSTNGAYLLIIQARSHSETSIRAVGFAVLVFVSFVVLSYLFRRIGNRMAMSGVAFASRADVVA